MALGESIRIKTRREIEAMRVAGVHVAEILLELRDRAKPGVTTGELDQHARGAIQKRRVESSVLGYGPHGLPPYPAVLCVSVNEEIVHGIPGRRELKEGDVLSLDFGISCEGYHGDSAFTMPVGAASGPYARMEPDRRELYPGIRRRRRRGPRCRSLHAGAAKPRRRHPFRPVPAQRGLPPRGPLSIL
jgi:methionyl aminopeptidase